MDYLSLLQSMTVVLSIALAASSVFIYSRKIWETKRAEQELIEIIRKNHSLRQKMLHFSKLDKVSNKDVYEMVSEIEKELNTLRNQEKKREIINVLEDNTEEGRKRYITNLRFSL